MLDDGRWLTAKEIARERGVPTGSFYGTLQRMNAEGWVEADSDPPTRGTQYRITPAGRAMLEASLAAEQPVGLLEAGQDVIVVEQGDRARRADFHRIFREAKLSGAVSWGATLGWGWMLVFEAETDEFPVDNLVGALEHAGFRCRAAQLRSVFTSAAMREQAEEHLRVAGGAL